MLKKLFLLPVALIFMSACSDSGHEEGRSQAVQSTMTGPFRTDGPSCYIASYVGTPLEEHACTEGTGAKRHCMQVQTMALQSKNGGNWKIEYAEDKGCPTGQGLFGCCKREDSTVCYYRDAHPADTKADLANLKQMQQTCVDSGWVWEATR